MSATFDAGAGPALTNDGMSEVWFYRRNGETSGPVSESNLQGLLGQCVIDGSTLIWREDFGNHWKRFDETPAWQRPQTPAAPPTSYGRWSKSFQKFDAKPKSIQWSFGGIIFGPLEYFFLGMWSKGLVIVSAYLAATLMITLFHNLTETSPTALPSILPGVLCAVLVKRDYYRFRVLGERMWPTLRILKKPYIAGGLVVLMAIANIAALTLNSPSMLSVDVSGVWQHDDLNVVIDTAGAKKTMRFNGSVMPVTIKSVDGGSDIIVFQEEKAPKKLITLRKKWDEDHQSFSLDMYLDDQFMAHLDYIRPL